MRSVLKDRLALILALAAPAAFLNAVHGQNAYLSTACLGFGLLMIGRRPWVAGLILGLLDDGAGLSLTSAHPGDPQG